MSLADEGFRYIHREGLGFTWMHPASIKPDDLDCTDMDDEAFEAIVQATSRTYSLGLQPTTTGT